MKTFIKTLLVAVTILFSVFATAKQVKLPNNIKYVNTTEAFSCTEIDGMNCQTKNPFNYKDNSYVFVLERGGACSVSRWHIPTPGVSRAMKTRC